MAGVPDLPRGDPRRWWRWVSWSIQIGAGLALLAVLVAYGPALLQRRDSSPITLDASPGVLPPLPVVTAQANRPIAPQDARALNAARPFASVPLVPARPFLFAGTGDELARARDCLAAAQIYEAGDDPVGERAVAQVVLNRVRHPAFPHSVCAVVFQGSERSTGCQFTFACDGAMARTPGAAAWARAQAIALAALSGHVTPEVGWATHYHTDWVVPYWIDTLDKIARVGTHLFYRWQGYWGTRPAFRAAPAAVEPRIASLARLSPVHGAADAAPEAVASTEAGAPVPPVAHAAPAVAAAAPSGRTIVLALDAGAFPGSYATQALAACQGRDRCEVLGWREPALRPATAPTREGGVRGLSFLYMRDATRGAETVRWDCAQTPRPQADQCLPTDARAITALRLKE